MRIFVIPAPSRSPGLETAKKGEGKEWRKRVGGHEGGRREEERRQEKKKTSQKKNKR